ncbi:unnamed protein product [Peronospora belbahrii]|uniref:Probable cytosolic iron-sulfur protein assembly protein CIAO1 homolog n=1 Tax=Peronospora belbahrii TaxID=622444 RepID=A0AAU9LLN9_9STRA|nr:unnamed protein product [Peronospora belbahrii]CAH0521290.1 unnamed protein product [Peronospora belbahrii]
MEQVCALEGHSERVWHVSWRFDSKLLASCSGDRTIRLWSANGSGIWECVGILEDAQGRTIRACEWSPDGRYLASVSFDATTVIWGKQGSSYEVISSLEGHESEVKSVAWSPSGAYLATCSRDKSIWIWEADADTDFECISVLHGHTQDVKCVVWHPTEDLLISASYDDTILIWAENDDDWYCKETLMGHTATVWGVALNSQGTEMVSVSDDKNLIIWQYDPQSKEVNEDGSIKQWKKTLTLSDHHERTIFSVDWSTHGDFLATGAGDNAIRVFYRNYSTNASSSFDLVVNQKQAHDSDVNCVRWSPQVLDNGGIKTLLLASAGDDGLVRIWNFHLP